MAPGGWRKSSYSGSGNTSCVEVSWRKSSYSGESGTNDCVEISWRKSTHSGDSGTGDCVEVAFTASAIGVRDSKNTSGPTLAFSPTAWRGFVSRQHT